MTVREFLGTLTVATTVKAKTHDDKNLLEATHTSDIFNIIGDYEVTGWKVTDANRVVMNVKIDDGGEN
jgi:hypothetical protein